MGFAGYFLIVMDFIRWAKLNGVPVGPGRGHRVVAVGDRRHLRRQIQRPELPAAGVPGPVVAAVVLETPTADKVEEQVVLA